MVSAGAIAWYKRISEKLKRLFDHPVVYAVSILLFCWTGVDLLLHLGTTWQNISLNALKSLNAFLLAFVSGISWLLKKRTKESEEKQDSEDS
jgi:hypothetical protein